MKTFTKIIAVAAVAALACLALTACGGKGGTIDLDKGTVDFTGKSVTVTLDENASTGYVWSVQQQPNGFEVTDEAKYKNSGAMAGAPGQRIFTITPAINDGEGTFVLVDSRSWEEGSEIAKVTLSITVQGGKITEVAATGE